jgi:hypothetical protein
LKQEFTSIWLKLEGIHYNPFTINQLYKYRWSIEVFFKRLKQNFQTDYFLSDSSNGIKIQIWIVLIANLLMSVIDALTKQKDCFSTTVTMAACNMSSYTNLIAIIYQERPSKKPKIRIVQLKLFSKNKGSFFENWQIMLLKEMQVHFH